jgi:hypothetical protein
MFKLVNVIVIDPFKQEVRWESFNDNGDPKELTEILGCTTIDVVKLGSDVIMFVDDNGLMYDNRYFSFKTVEKTQAFAGICVLALTDGEGGTKSFERDIGSVREIIEWKHEGYKEEPFMAFVPLDDTVLH